MYSSSTVANYFLHKGWSEGILITPMKILKLVYVAHGWYLGSEDRPLIGDRILAWPYGPVIPELFLQISHFKDKPVTTPIKPTFYSADQQTFDESLRTFLDTIWEHYKNFTPYQLSALTHQSGSPWSQVTESYSKKELYRNSIIIPNEIIQYYYKQKLSPVENKN